MLNMRTFFLVAVVIVFGGCEPTINTQQITQSAQNLRENVRNIDTQRITQGAQNLKENLQNFRTSSSTQIQNTDAAPESLQTTDPVLAGILGDVLDEEPVTTTVAGEEIGELDTTRLSDENDFEAVSERQSIESDAERVEKNRALYVLIEPTSLPRRPGSNVPSIVEYAIKTTNPVGTQLYSRQFASKTRFDWNCAKYSSQSAAQEAFLVWGGPRVDPKGIDPDGDGFACYWDPKPFRSVLKDTN
ncbi:MAG: hypothetical protein L7U86_05590 [Rhodobacteraceae bacterium]|nr:hypothetical protein [Paracoccaceae bacterium]